MGIRGEKRDCIRPSELLASALMNDGLLSFLVSYSPCFLLLRGVAYGFLEVWQHHRRAEYGTEERDAVLPGN